VLVCRFATLVRFLTMLMSTCSVFFRLVVLATLVMMRCFSVMVGCGLMFSRGEEMMLARFVLSF
jgi:hypothetical protein